MAKRLRRHRDSGASSVAVGTMAAGSHRGRQQVHIAGYVPSRVEAEKTLAAALADRHRGNWIDPRDGRIDFYTYSTRWLEERASLRPRTRELYEGLLRLHIVPYFGRVELCAVTPSMVR